MLKKIILFWLCFHISYLCFSQADVYSFFKLIVTNKDKQVLLVNWDGSWELPGARYNLSRSTRQFIDTIASDHGIKVNGSKLKGLFTFHYATRANPTLMLYFTTFYLNGALKVPADCSDIRWFSLEEANKVIPYSEMKTILQKLHSSGNDTWGGAFKLEGSGKDRKSSVLEEFYKLN